MKWSIKRLLQIAANKNYFNDYEEAIRVLIAIVDAQEERIKKLEECLKNDN